jgi:hypothetical protein
LGLLEAWFAGLIDGEGCFSVSVYIQHKHALKFSPFFAISMKSGSWQETVQLILRRHRIPFHTRFRKNQCEIAITGHESVKRLIQVVKPHLVVKRQVAEALLDFPTAPPRNRFIRPNRKYLEEACARIDLIRLLNKGKNRRYKWDGEAIRKFYDE